MTKQYALTQEQNDWLAHARLHGYWHIADSIEANWRKGRTGQVDGRTPLPGLKRELNRINGLVAKGDYYD